MKLQFYQCMGFESYIFFSFHAHEVNLDLKALGCALSLARLCV